MFAEPALWLPRPDVDALKTYFKGVTLQDVMQLRMPLFLAGEWAKGTQCNEDAGRLAGSRKY